MGENARGAIGDVREPRQDGVRLPETEAHGRHLSGAHLQVPLRLRQMAELRLREGQGVQLLDLYQVLRVREAALPRQVAPTGVSPCRRRACGELVERPRLRDGEIAGRAGTRG